MTRRPDIEWIGIVLAIALLAVGTVLLGYLLVGAVSWIVSVVRGAPI